MVVSPVVSPTSASSKTERELLDCSTVLCYLLAQHTWQGQVTLAIWGASRQQRESARPRTKGFEIVEVLLIGIHHLWELLKEITLLLFLFSPSP